MAKSIWRILENMSPIDWEYLAAQHAARKYRRWTPAQIAKLKAAHRKRRKARAKAAAERVTRRLIEERRSRRDSHITAKILAAMQPGDWYGRPDIRDRSGVCRNSVHARLAKLEREGFVERAENVDFVPTEYPKGTQIHFQARARPPRWLFKLTAKGEVERDRLASLL